jgi:hypothetical protein
MLRSEVDALYEVAQLAAAAIARRFVVIPTRFDRSTTLPLIEVCREVAVPVIVHTEPGHDEVPGTVTLHDFSLSIQKWWNTGLDQCAGPTLVLNDDIVATANDLDTLFVALENADVVYLSGHRVGHRTPLTGWCYGIRPDVIRPDEDFGWWAGDDDLYLRAVRDGLRVVAVDVPTIRHERSAVAFSNPVHAEMAQRDMTLLAERWP